MKDGAPKRGQRKIEANDRKPMASPMLLWNSMGAAKNVRTFNNMICTLGEGGRTEGFEKRKQEAYLLYRSKAAPR